MAKPRRTQRSVAESAVRRVSLLEQDVVNMHKLFLRDPVTYGKLVVKLDEEHVTRRQFSDAIFSAISPEERSLLEWFSESTGSTPAEDLIQMMRWAANRVVYACDPTMVAAISSTDWGGVMIPGEVLRRLPHPNPLILLPEPLYLPSDEPGHMERYEAIIVCGVRDTHRCSTHDADVDGYVLHYLGRVVDEITKRDVVVSVPSINGGMRSTNQVIGMRVVTPLRDATMDERREVAVSEVMRKSGALPSGEPLGFNNREEAVRVTRELVDFGLSLLTYMVTDEADTKVKRVGPIQSSKRQPAVPDPTTVVEVGYRIGSALRKHRDQDTSSSTPDGTRKSPSAHVRKAHFHSFRRGPGKREVFLKWLPPIPVAWRDSTPKTTVHLTPSPRLKAGDS